MPSCAGRSAWRRRKDLSKITGPAGLYDGRPLTGRWMGVNSIRWFVALREPIVTGKETAEYDNGGGLGTVRRRRLIGNYGFWMLAAGFVVGLLIFFNQLDVQEKEPEPVDRDPGNRGRGGALMLGEIIPANSGGGLTSCGNGSTPFPPRQ